MVPVVRRRRRIRCGAWYRGCRGFCGRHRVQIHLTVRQIQVCIASRMQMKGIRASNTPIQMKIPVFWIAVQQSHLQGAQSSAVQGLENRRLVWWKKNSFSDSVWVAVGYRAGWTFLGFLQLRLGSRVEVRVDRGVSGIGGGPNGAV
uniref:Uncharacterized protein n=1 Tax=Bursaphelenchus xylophilus TaxID=6326 RepID=A0A1I7SPK3_BURXY